ncbi:GNAT family N-acetyltransferase [Allohahella sp. A8]|uniref:GNAT family N-acetyltransferase n=1 Tax=Allohahella sp. A8 TaxID=3141461 RepID=UPI000C0A5D72|nr:GNAT family N-acetyltransferase [Hahellaceae bacterium]|tara:strand:- start:14628 stop:15044 length:417 start_codon:yes stop_codon:yes gene_type:complete
MTIEYRINHSVSADQFIGLLENTSLGVRRPLDDRTCIEGMIRNANLIISAWDSSRLVGIARSVTDFHYACYLSDLAVDEAYQTSGIGKRLQVLTQQQLGPHCSIILLAAPLAKDYYGRIGYTHNERCWVLSPGESLSE